jgi:hypothetical protein
VHNARSSDFICGLCAQEQKVFKTAVQQKKQRLCNGKTGTTTAKNQQNQCQKRNLGIEI